MNEDLIDNAIVGEKMRLTKAIINQNHPKRDREILVCIDTILMLSKLRKECFEED